MKQYVLKGENLSKIYPGDGIEVVALREASFEIYLGEFVVVLGPSGSGKSTFLNMLGGMDRPTGGKLWYRGAESEPADRKRGYRGTESEPADGKAKSGGAEEENAVDLTEFNNNKLSDYRREAVGFVFQFFNLIPSLTALENVKLSAQMVKDAENPAEMLKLVNLEGREKHFPSQMSGGEQQRVSIARAVVKKPKLLLCDEPTGALDSENSLEVVKLLVEVKKKIGCPVIAITHNAAMAQIADRVFYMKDGRLVKITENASPLPVDELEW